MEGLDHVDYHSSEVEVAVVSLSSPEKVSFTVWESFETFQDLERNINDYEQSNSVQLWKRDARTVQIAQKRLPNRTLNERIKYYEITYACIHGGKKFRPSGNGKRITL